MCINGTRENSAFIVRCTDVNIKSSRLSCFRMYFDELDNGHFHASTISSTFLFFFNLLKHKYNILHFDRFL